MPYSHIIILGDSLSDRGAMKQTRPIVAKMAGLGRSPLGRFTDDEVWGDLLARKAIRKTLEEGIRSLQNEVEQMDEYLQNNPLSHKDRKEYIKRLREKRKQLRVQRKYAADISHHKNIQYKGQQFLRSYAEGGLTAADWGVMETRHIPSMGARAMVSTLSQKVEQLLQDDRDNHVKPDQKKSTLVIEWSGANDLATVTQNPTKETVQRAVAARIANAKRLIDNGYTNIVLFNLPGLENSPRYQSMPSETRERVAELSELFNRTLQSEVDKLIQTSSVELHVEIFDANALAQQSREEKQKIKDEDEAKALELVERFLDTYNQKADVKLSITDIKQLPGPIKKDLNMFVKIEKLSDSEPNYHAKVLAIIVQHAKKNPRSLSGQVFKELEYDKINHHVMEVAKGDYYRHGGNRTHLGRRQLSDEGLNFYDDVHPTSPLHEKLAETFWERYGHDVDITKMELPANALVEEISEQYMNMIRQKLSKRDYDSKKGFVSAVNQDSQFFKDLRNKPNPDKGDYQEMLVQIFMRVQSPDGELIRETINSLEYDTSLVHPDLIDARREAQRRILSAEPTHDYNQPNYKKNELKSLDEQLQSVKEDVTKYWDKKIAQEHTSLGYLLSKTKNGEDPISKKGQKRQEQVRALLGLLDSLLENKNELIDHQRALEVCAQLEMIKKEIKSEFNIKKSSLYAVCDKYSQAIKNDAKLDSQEIKERMVFKQESSKQGKRFTRS